MRKQEIIQWMAHLFLLGLCLFIALWDCFSVVPDINWVSLACDIMVFLLIAATFIAHSLKFFRRQVFEHAIVYFVAGALLLTQIIYCIMRIIIDLSFSSTLWLYVGAWLLNTLLIILKATKKSKGGN